jgi:hypothetical protein
MGACSTLVYLRRSDVFVKEAIRAIELSATSSDEMKEHLITHLLRIERHLTVLRTFSPWSNHAS